VVKISANLEMVEQESLLKLVELSWNDPIDMGETVLDKECITKLKEILLSDNTIGRRIHARKMILN